MNTSKPNKVLVFSETRGGRVLVGALTRKKGHFLFTYERAYQRLKNAIPLGPELPLWRDRITSDELFPTLADRIPSRRNPAYDDYCRQWGIDPKEGDPFVLLTTIGRRGPSTFVFEPESLETYGAAEVKAFRNRLGLNQREFGALFGISHATLVKIEKARSKNPLILNFLQICDDEPRALQRLLELRGCHLGDWKRETIDTMAAFQEAWQSSPAAQIMAGSPKGRLSYGEKGDEFIPLVFGVFMNKTLGRLDELVTRFEIAEKGKKHARNMLEEDWRTYQDPKWLSEDREKRRTHRNRTLSLIAELAVADHLRSQGKDIRNLGAWVEEEKAPDIIFRDGAKEHVAEVKLIPESPESFKSVINALKGEESAYKKSVQSTVDYVFFKPLKKAVAQLKPYPRESREVWLVFDCHHPEPAHTMRQVLDYLRWCEEEKAPALSDAAEGCRAKVRELVKKTRTLVLAEMKGWTIAQTAVAHRP